jgi:hypothetical protein
MLLTGHCFGTRPNASRIGIAPIPFPMITPASVQVKRRRREADRGLIDALEAWRAGCRADVRCGIRCCIEYIIGKRVAAAMDQEREIPTGRDVVGGGNAACDQQKRYCDFRLGQSAAINLRADCNNSFSKRYGAPILWRRCGSTATNPSRAVLNAGRACPARGEGTCPMVLLAKVAWLLV